MKKSTFDSIYKKENEKLLERLKIYSSPFVVGTFYRMLFEYASEVRNGLYQKIDEESPAWARKELLKTARDPKLTSRIMHEELQELTRTLGIEFQRNRGSANPTQNLYYLKKDCGRITPIYFDKILEEFLMLNPVEEAIQPEAPKSKAPK
jgi:hypothetical protein